jgi:hypothetical protein
MNLNSIEFQTAQAAYRREQLAAVPRRSAARSRIPRSKRLLRLLPSPARPRMAWAR